MNWMGMFRQWQERPVGERFWNIQEAIEADRQLFERSQERMTSTEGLMVVPSGEELSIVGKAGIPARLTHWSMGQLCARIGCPADFMRKVGPELAATNMNHMITTRPADDLSLLLHRADQGWVVGAATSEKYARIWDWRAYQRLAELSGWGTPPSRPRGLPGERTRIATPADIFGGTRLRVGDIIAPGSVMKSDRDSVVMLVSKEKHLRDGLFRAVVLSNSIVGSRFFEAMLATYNSVCGNLILWDARILGTIRIRHVGEAPERAMEFLNRIIIPALEASPRLELDRIQAAEKFLIGANEKECIEVLRRPSVGLTKEQADKAMAASLNHPEDRGQASPFSAWGVAQGITRISQEERFDQFDLDKAAGKVLGLTF